MNNLQHIVKDNTRFAMHMAVELCEQGDFDSVAEAVRWLMQEREAANTIENLRDSLNEVADKWASEKIKAEDYARENMMLKANNGSRWFELFGTPERTARTLETIADSLFSSAWSDDNATLSDVMCALAGKCDECVAQGLPGRGVSTKCGEVDYDALLEWLRGDA